ncbi:MAG: hypothetical protein GX270_15840 [Clostridiaceae bacterium]|nr:hypothetical protein [Clostridiaceae bacterium]
MPILITGIIIQYIFLLSIFQATKLAFEAGQFFNFPILRTIFPVFLLNNFPLTGIVSGFITSSTFPIIYSISRVGGTPLGNLHIILQSGNTKMPDQIRDLPLVIIGDLLYT